MARYTATVDGNLIDTKNDITLHCKKTAIISSGRQGQAEKLAITLDSGAKAIIARWNVDESAHSFGAALAKATNHQQRIEKNPPGPRPARPGSAQGDGIYLTRKEILDLYATGKALIDLTLPKLLPDDSAR